MGSYKAVTMRLMSGRKTMWQVISCDATLGIANTFNINVRFTSRYGVVSRQPAVCCWTVCLLQALCTEKSMYDDVHNGGNCLILYHLLVQDASAWKLQASEVQARTVATRSHLAYGLAVP